MVDVIAGFGAVSAAYNGIPCVMNDAVINGRSPGREIIPHRSADKDPGDKG